MKAKLSLVALVMAGFIVFAACGTTSSSSTSSSGSTASSAAYTTGQSFGGSLLGLYSQYKSNGNKIDFKNTTTLLQLMQLSTSVTVIKQNLSNKTFYGQFVQGAVVGSQQNVTQSNASSIIDTLTGLNFGNIAQASTGNGTVNSSTATTVTNTLSTLFNMFGK
ncbi:MAG: hypothetical protein LBT04_01430 [Prevotellaceae bacterium]|jgi:hypothetical protein|nr:hypothetical protein [Prevotellaceae bacterium]